MARRDPDKVQLDFPQLTADLISALRLTGTVGLLGLSDQVVPTFLIGSRGISFGGDLPDFTSSEVFSGTNINAVANAVVFDTGPLVAGTYDALFNIEILSNAAGANTDAQVQHRNAANAVSLAVLGTVHRTNSNFAMVLSVPLFGYTVELNERIRFINGPTALIGSLSGSLFLTLRPTP